MIQPKSRPARAMCALLLFLAACQDVPTAIVSAPRSERPRLSSDGQHLGQVPFFCTLGRRTPAALTGWEMRRVTLFFPRAELDGAGRTVSYRYWLADPDGRPLSAAECVVPYTTAAARRVDRYFGVEKDGGAEQMAARERSIMTETCISDGMCVLNPLVVVAPPPEPSDFPPCPGCEAPFPGTFPGGDGGYGGGGSPAPNAYEEGPLLWAGCVLALLGTTYSVWQVSDKFQTWYNAHRDAAGAQGLWQATVQNNADPYIQQLYEYQYRQAHQRAEDAKGAVSEATRASYFALTASAIACGATALLPTP